jgi:hypothetical protein
MHPGRGVGMGNWGIDGNAVGLCALPDRIRNGNGTVRSVLNAGIPMCAHVHVFVRSELAVEQWTASTAAPQCRSSS